MATPSAKHSGNPALIKIGNTIRKIRADRKISQEALAYEAGIDRSYMGGIERGEHNITVMNLMKVASQLDIKLSTLLEKADL